MSNETPEQIAKRIINQVCLVPNEGVCGVSSHENLTSKCCCELQKEVTQAILEAEKRGEDRVLGRLPSAEEMLKKELFIFDGDNGSYEQDAELLHNWLTDRLKGE